MSDQGLLDEVRTLTRELATQKEQMGAAIERVKEFKSNFGVREKQGGVIAIDYEKFANGLGLEGCLELRKVIDEVWKISGEAGDKPRVKLVAQA